VRRQLLIAAALAAPLYLRQREVEKRQRLWRRALTADMRRFSDDVNEGFRECAKAQGDWADDVVQQLNRVLRKAAAQR
jgi:hypothetical protein